MAYLANRSFFVPMFWNLSHLRFVLVVFLWLPTRVYPTRITLFLVWSQVLSVVLTGQFMSYDKSRMNSNRLEEIPTPVLTRELVR